MAVQTLKQKQQAQDKERQAYAFFTSQGWKPHQAIGIIGNLKRESGLNHNAVGDSGQALGLAQWHPDRQQKAKQLYGENWKSFENQLKFVDWELNNTEKSAGDKLRNSKGVWEAGKIVSDDYERPKVKFNADDERQRHVSDLAMKFKGIKLTPEDMPYYGATYANSVAPYMNPQDESQQYTSDINYFNIPQKGTTFASVPTPEEEKPQEKETQTEEDYATSAEAERVEKESNFLKEIEKLQNQDYAHLEPQKTVEQEEVQPVDYLQKYNEISQFIDEPIMGEQQSFQQQTAQQGLTWQEKLANRPKKLTVAELIAENNARQPQQNEIQRDNTQVNTQKPNILELKNIIKDNDELEKSGAIKTPKAEANKFEKYLPDESTIKFFEGLREDVGDEYFRRALKLQHKSGNPSVNVGTGKGLIFSNRRNYNPFTNEINIPKGLLPEDNFIDYATELPHAIESYPSTAFKFIANDVPNYVKSYLQKGDTRENIEENVYNNPKTVEYNAHRIIQPKIEYELTNFQQGGGKQQNYAQQAIIKKPFQLQDERNLVQRDNIPTFKKQDKIRVLTKAEKEARRIAEIKARQGEIRQHTPQSTFSRVKEIGLNPLTAAGYAARNEDLPENFSKGARNPLDYAIDVINPVQYVEDTKNVLQGIARGDIGQVGEGLLGVVPLGLEAKNIYKGVDRLGSKYLPKSNLNYSGIFDEEGVSDFMQILKNKKEADKAIEIAKNDLTDPETIRRATELGIDPELLQQASNNMTYTTQNSTPSSFNSGDFSININPKQIGRSKKQEMVAEIMGDLSPNFTANEIASHEWGHVFQNTPLWKEGYKKTVSNDIKKLLSIDTEGAKKIRGYWENYSTRDAAPTKVDELLGDIDFKEGINKGSYADKNRSYFENANNRYGTNVDNKIERLPMFREYRQGLRDSGILKNKWDEITPEMVDEYYKLKPENRLNSFMDMTDKNKNLIREVSKIAPSLAGASYLATQGQKDLSTKQQGGTAEEKDMQWLQDWYANRVIPNKEVNDVYQKQKNDYEDLSHSIPYPTYTGYIPTPKDWKGGRIEGMESADGSINLVSPPNETIGIHEYTHFVDRRLGDLPMEGVHKSIVDQNVAPIEGINAPYIKDNYKYYTEPTEVHARVQELRKKAGFKPNQEVKEEDLNKFLKTYKGDVSGIEDLLNMTDTPHLIEILNTMAYTPKKGNSNVAQQGGKKQQNYTENELAFLSEIAIKDNNGYWNPNNQGKVVEIDSPNITMKGVSQKLIGISKQTGEKKIMKPNRNYSFADTKQVIEIPFFKK